MLSTTSINIFSQLKYTGQINTVSGGIIYSTFTNAINTTFENLDVIINGNINGGVILVGRSGTCVLLACHFLSLV